METNADKVFKSLERKARKSEFTCSCGNSELEIVRLKDQKESIMESCRSCGQIVGVDYPKYALRIMFICPNCEAKKIGYQPYINEYTIYDVRMMLKKPLSETKMR